MLTPNNVGSNNYGPSCYFTWLDATGTAQVFYPDLVVSEAWSNPATMTEHPVEQGANVIDHVRVELCKLTLTIFATNEPVGANTWADPGGAQGAAISGGYSPSSATKTSSVSASVWDSNLTARGIAVAAGDLAATAAASAIGGIGGGLVGEATIFGAGLLEGILLAGHATSQSVAVVAGSPAAPQVSDVANVQFFAETQDFVERTIGQLLYLKSTAQIVSVYGSKQVQPKMCLEDVSYTRSEGEGTGAEITLSFKEIRLVQTQTSSAALPSPSVPSASSNVAKGTQNPEDAAPAPQESVASWVVGLFGGGSTPTVP